MKSWRVVSLLAVLFLASGCGRGEPSHASRARGGELRVLLPAEPRTLDPNSPQDEIAFFIAPNLFSKLVALDADSRLFPDLAESWRVEAGGLAYVFKLREDVRWHDGRPFSAADVEWTLKTLQGRPSLASEALRRITAIETPDDYTVVLRLREPWAPFLATMAWAGTYILPRHRAESGDPGEPLREPVGTGPFKLLAWVPGEGVTLAANPDFFRPGPYVDRVAYQAIRGSAAQVPSLLQGGEADYSLPRPPLALLPALARDARLKVTTLPSNGRYYMLFNLRRAPFGDLRVREAVNRAIDRQALVDGALYGYGAPGLGFYTPAIAWAYNGKAHVPALDPARARELLDAAGLPPGPQGVRFTPELLAPNLPPFPEIMEALAAQLREVGIAVRPVLVPHQEWVERTMTRHDFDLVLVSGSQGPDPENLNFRFGSRNAGPLQGYASAAFDAAVADGARTVDLSRRALAYARAQEILARDLPIAPLAESVHVTITRAGVTGLPQVEARGLVPQHDFSLVRLEAAPLSGAGP